MDSRLCRLTEWVGLIALDSLHKPYIWGANGPEAFDCSGFLGFILKQVKALPDNYDDTAQGYYNRYKCWPLDNGLLGAAAFYGKDEDHITHVMVCINDRVCIGAVRGNKWVDTPEKAQKRGARVDVRPIKYRPDLVAILDPFDGHR